MKEKLLYALVLSLLVLLCACSGQKENLLRAKMDIRTIRMALLGYATWDGSYPTTEQGLQALITKPTLPPDPAGWDGPYLEPKFLIDPWGNKYIYRSPSIEDAKRYKYDLYSCGPNGKEGDGDDITIRDIEKIIEQQ